MSDDQQLETPTTSSPNPAPVIDPQTLVNEALTSSPTSTPLSEKIEGPKIEEAKTVREEIKLPKEELPLAFAPRMNKPVEPSPQPVVPPTSGVVPPTPRAVPPIPRTEKPVTPTVTQSPISEQRKKGKGTKIVAMVLGFFLLAGSVVAGYFVYQQRFGETAQIAEVATVCNDNSITVSNCRGKPVGYQFCLDGDSRKMYCFSTSNGNCGREYINPEDNSCGDGDGGGTGESGTCSSSSPTHSLCYGKNFGYVVDANWLPGTNNCESSFDYTKVEGNTYSLVCQKTNNNDCGAFCVKNTGGVSVEKTIPSPPSTASCPPGECTYTGREDSNGAKCANWSNWSGCGVSSPGIPYEYYKSIVCGDNTYYAEYACSIETPSTPPVAPTMSCNGLTKNMTDSQIVIGTEIIFTCNGSIVPASTETITYSYRIKKDLGEWENLATANNMASYTIKEAGSYRAECRACAQVLGVSICNPLWTGASQ